MNAISSPPYLHDKVGVGEPLALVAHCVVDQPEAKVEPNREDNRAPVDDRPRLRLNAQLGDSNSIKSKRSFLFWPNEVIENENSHIIIVIMIMVMISQV